MTTSGDQVRVSVSVAIEPANAFRVFTEEIDLWWRRGIKFRASGKGPGVLRMEPKVGGRLYETVTDESGVREVQSGEITIWSPPQRLVFIWRATNFAADEATEVEVLFEPHGSSTMVTLTHRGWSDIRLDHPARHGLDVSAFCQMLAMWWSDLMTSYRLNCVERAS